MHKFSNGASSLPGTDMNPEIPVKRGWILSFFHGVTFITAFTAFAAAFAHMIAIYFFTFSGASFIFHYDLFVFNVVASVIDLLIRFYGIVIVLGIAQIELEVSLAEWLRTFVLIQQWFTRGLLYIFSGLLVFIQYPLVRKNGYHDYAYWFINVSGLLLIAMCAIYSVMVREKSLIKFALVVTQIRLGFLVRGQYALNLFEIGRWQYTFSSYHWQRYTIPNQLY